jgi:hypothetical protein
VTGTANRLLVSACVYPNFAVTPSRRGENMKKMATVLLVLLGLSACAAAQTPEPQPVSKKTKTSAKSTPPPAKPADPSPKITYAELTIGELNSEDANRWSDKMASRVAIGGFITDISKVDGDTAVRICENPKVEGMDRGHCIVAKCIPKLPCDLPTVGKPITVKGPTRYDAKVGDHWWEIIPVEQIDK